jgi:pyrroloquinoline quinone biosynthesis protein B
MLRIMVLGSAAGGGLPQWNCNCGPCRAARDMGIDNGQVSLAATVDGGKHWFIINASPDLRSQILRTPALWPDPGKLRHSPIAGVILTNAEIDAVGGLLSMREGHAFAIHAHQKVLSTLAANPIFNVLDPTRVPRVPFSLDVPFEPKLADGTPSGLIFEAFDVPGKIAWYLEQTAAADDDTVGDTIGLRLTCRDSGKSAFVLTACARVTPELADRLHGADLVFMDGTLWRDDEMIVAGLANKTGQRMGHLSMSGQDGAMASLADLGIRQKVFIHINNSNPAFLPDSPERLAAQTAGWIIPMPNEEFAP